MTQKAIKDTLIRDHIIASSSPPKHIDLAGIKTLFFDPVPLTAEEEKALRPQYSKSVMNRLMVNINAIIVNMQKYVLESVRKGLKEGVLSEDVFTPQITNHSLSDHLGTPKAAS